MLFHSGQFIIFFVLVFLIYYLIPHRFRWFMLLLASYYFYMCWNPGLIILIFFLTVLHYFAALMINKIDITQGSDKGRVQEKIILYFPDIELYFRCLL